MMVEPGSIADLLSKAGVYRYIEVEPEELKCFNKHKQLIGYISFRTLYRFWKMITWVDFAKKRRGQFVLDAKPINTEQVAKLLRKHIENIQTQAEIWEK